MPTSSALVLPTEPADVNYFSAGLLPAFSHHGADLEEPGIFAKVVEQVSFRREIILVCGDAKPTASSANGLNTLMQLRNLRLHHVLYLSDSAASCAALRHVLPEVACVWSSRISAKKPKAGGLCVQLYWGYAFYFYDLRKHYAARMAIEFGINVLQTDTDVVWLANPYPALKRVFGGQQIIGMSGKPMINAGVFYAQNVRRGDGASWVLQELSRRIHTFILRPSAVRDYVPWAQPPYYANVDEQTLMNDCVRSSIANVSSFAQATAGWEVKKHRTGTVMNKSFAWKRTAEYRLLGWLNKVVPAAGTRPQLASPPPRITELCGAPAVKSPGIAYPLHFVGSSAPPRPASLAIGPSWLFMHLPSSMAATSIRKCRSNQTTSSNPEAASAASASSSNAAAPFIMGHLAGVRTGAWSRRALVRTYGWWNPQADGLIAKQLGWARRPAGELRLLEESSSSATGKGSDDDDATLMGSVINAQARLDTLVANMLLIGALAGRTIVVPEFPCAFTSGSSHRGYGNRPVGARAAPGGAPSCAWMPPKDCWATEYTTQLEFERKGTAAASSSSAVPASNPSCDEASAIGHAMAQAAEAAAGSSVGLTFAALRRRLQELQCDTRPLVSILPGATGDDAGQVAARRKHRAQMLELLARAPIFRYPKLNTLSSASGLPNAALERLRSDAGCIESLMRHAASGGAKAS